MVQKAVFLPGSDDEVVDVEFESSAANKTDAENKTDAIADALNDDQEAFINVSRQTFGGNSPMEFVGRYAADKYDFGQLQVHLQKQFGGGDYRCMLYANGRVRANKLISIAVEKLEPGSGGELEAILGTMQQMQSQMINIMQGNAAPAESEDKILNRMLMYKQIFDNGGGNTNAISQFREFLELQELLGGNQKEDAGFSELLDKVTPLIETAITDSPQPKQQSRSRPSVNPEKRKQLQMQMKLKMGIAQLVKAASKNSDQSIYAELVLDQLPLAVIESFVTSPEALKKLATIDRGVVKYKEWFLLLGEHMKAQLGLESTVSELYQQAESDIVPEETEPEDLELETEQDGEAQISTAPDS